MAVARRGTGKWRDAAARSAAHAHQTNHAFSRRRRTKRRAAQPVWGGARLCAHRAGGGGRGALAVGRRAGTGHYLRRQLAGNPIAGRCGPGKPGCASRCARGPVGSASTAGSASARRCAPGKPGCAGRCGRGPVGSACAAGSASAKHCGYGECCGAVRTDDRAAGSCGAAGFDCPSCGRESNEAPDRQITQSTQIAARAPLVRLRANTRGSLPLSVRLGAASRMARRRLLTRPTRSRPAFRHKGDVIYRPGYFGR